MKKSHNFKIKEVLYFDTYRLFLTEEKEGKETMYYSYLQNISYGIISMLVGMSKKSISFKEFKAICLNNLYEDIKIYEEMYEDINEYE